MTAVQEIEPRTILIVEDDTIISSALRMLFERRGWKARVASTLRQAYAQFDPPPEWVIADLMLPDGDGADLLREIRARSLATRTIIATGVHDPQRLRSVQELEPAALLQKPVSFMHLLAALGAEHEAPNLNPSM